MKATEIEEILSNRYIDNVSSNLVKIVMEDGNSIEGEFIKALQFKINVKFNKWNMSCTEGADIILNGGKIVSIIAI